MPSFTKECDWANRRAVAVGFVLREEQFGSAFAMQPATARTRMFQVRSPARSRLAGLEAVPVRGSRCPTTRYCGTTQWEAAARSAASGPRLVDSDSDQDVFDDQPLRTRRRHRSSGSRQRRRCRSVRIRAVACRAARFSSTRRLYGNAACGYLYRYFM